MNKKSLIVSSVITSVLLLQGCGATIENKSAPPPEVSAISDDLRAAAYAIKKENEQLAYLEQEKLRLEGAVPPVNQESSVTGRLAKKMTIKWTGEVEPLLEVITKNMGYKTFTIKNIEGQRPIVPAIIKINANDETAFKILKDIGWQLGAKTKIAVDRRNQLIRLIYMSDQ